MLLGKKQKKKNKEPYASRTEGNSAILFLSGEVDMKSSPRARAQLLDMVAAGKAVLVDMSEVSYIDSSGVATLVEGLQAARKAGAAFALVAVSPSARQVLELARLDQVFTLYDDLEQALATVGR